MDYSRQFLRQLLLPFGVLNLLALFGSIGAWKLYIYAFPSDHLLQRVCWGLTTLILSGIASFIAIKIAFKPLGTLADIIVFAGHSKRGGVAPRPESLRVGRDLVTTLSGQIYDMASMADHSEEIAESTSLEKPQSAPSKSSNIVEHLPLPLFGIDSNQIITSYNQATLDYFELKEEDLSGKPLYDVIKLVFGEEETFEAWLADRQKNSLKDVRIWERTKHVGLEGNTLKQFDLAASFNKASTDGSETVLLFFDRTKTYARYDQETSFVALAVHELRTPLTVMKGYIEVFEDEVGPQLTPELKSFMHKMQASAQQLTAFVANILNVARIEENQLVLKLQKYDWHEIVKSAVEDLSLRAAVYGINIEMQIDPTLPPVAVDRISIHEVINNLVDNAIKYSGTSTRITITAQMNKEGLVETNVRDYGLGIPPAVVPDLFKKYYRSHKSRVQVSGTGLGLYLCKALVNAHGGNIWVRTKENEGSMFSFTIQPYDQMKHEESEGKDGIMRGAHGWIKNHSLNRQ